MNTKKAFDISLKKYGFVLRRSLSIGRFFLEVRKEAAIFTDPVKMYGNESHDHRRKDYRMQEVEPDECKRPSGSVREYYMADP